MACRDAYIRIMQAANEPSEAKEKNNNIFTEKPSVERRLFGVNSKVQANDILQNNLTLFEWATRNKLYPNFWGRYISGENSLTKNEIKFLHRKGCKIAAMYRRDSAEKKTEAQGKALAKKIDTIAVDLGIPANTAIFLEVSAKETATRDFMKGYIKEMLYNGYTPAFKANTDAAYAFDRELSRGLQTDKEVFNKCLIWAVAPSLPEYDGITTTHLIHPDKWGPYAPSGTKRQDIAIWQYGKDCHPIYDDVDEKEVTFNLDLVKDERVIIEKMF